MQAFVTGFAKLAEDLEVATAAGEDAAGSEQQLIQVAMHGNARLRQRLTDGLIAAAFVDAVLFVQVQCLNLVLAADLQQHIRGLVPGVGFAHQQRDVQCGQALA
ncbi:hypothetical protein D9M71_631840 [compost metagenome]